MRRAHRRHLQPLVVARLNAALRWLQRGGTSAAHLLVCDEGVGPRVDDAAEAERVLGELIRRRVVGVRAPNGVGGGGRRRLSPLLRRRPLRSRARPLRLGGRRLRRLSLRRRGRAEGRWCDVCVRCGLSTGLLSRRARRSGRNGTVWGGSGGARGVELPPADSEEVRGAPTGGGAAPDGRTVLWLPPVGTGARARRAGGAAGGGVPRRERRRPPQGRRGGAGRDVWRWRGHCSGCGGRAPPSSAGVGA